MKDLGRLRRIKPNDVEGDFVVLTIALGIVVVVLIAVIIYLIFLTNNFYSDSLKACIENGYSEYFCRRSM